MAEVVEKAFEVVQMEPFKQVDLRDKIVLAQLKPVKLYCLPNGIVDEKESYMWLMVDGNGHNFVAQISKKMLQEAFSEIGKTWEVQ